LQIYKLFYLFEQSDPSILPEVLADLMGKIMLFKISIGADNLKSMKAAYVVENFGKKQIWLKKSQRFSFTFIFF